MGSDTFYALCILGLLMVVITFKRFSQGFLEMLLNLTRPGATLLVLGTVLVLYMKKMLYSSLSVALVGIYLLKDVWRAWPLSDSRRLFLEIGRDEARFNPSTSIDLQFANGTAKHDSPELLSGPISEQMLIFPPSAETLREMNGD